VVAAPSLRPRFLAFSLVEPGPAGVTEDGSRASSSPSRQLPGGSASEPLHRSAPVPLRSGRNLSAPPPACAIAGSEARRLDTPLLDDGARPGAALALLDRWVVRSGSEAAESQDYPTLEECGWVARERQLIVISRSDFSARACAEGWDFWRGVMVGLFAGLPLTYAAVTGQRLLQLAYAARPPRPSACPARWRRRRLAGAGRG
jgi:hypothetical protein